MTEQPTVERPTGGVVEAVAAGCVRCGRCRKECGFLQRHGLPGDIAAASPLSGIGWPPAFQCSLCGLCSAVCPQQLDLPAMFLAMRRQSDANGGNRHADRCTYIGYENRGTSRHLSYTALPDGCRTVYFPGCSFPAGRPMETLQLFDLLAEEIPALGIVLDCCAKPSHDLGRGERFSQLFGALHAVLVANGIERILVNCPNCYKVFSQYGAPVTVESVYAVLDRRGIGAAGQADSGLTIHDPCVLRFDQEVQDTVRRLLTRGGHRIEEMPHHRARTLCCGNGASVSCWAPDLADQWQRRRLAEGNGNPVVTYCAGCAARLSAIHVLDLVLNPGYRLSDPPRRTHFPITCYNRARLKRRFSHRIDAAFEWTRSPASPLSRGKSRFNRQTLAYIISAAVSRLAR